MSDETRENIVTTVFLCCILLFSLYTGYKAETTIEELQAQVYTLQAENRSMRNYIIDNDMNYTEEVIK